MVGLSGGAKWLSIALCREGWSMLLDGRVENLNIKLALLSHSTNDLEKHELAVIWFHGKNS